MSERCGLAALISAGGPVRVAVRPCCLVALVGHQGSEPATAESACAAAEASEPAEMTVPPLQVSP